MKCSAIAWIARFRHDRFMLLIAFLAGLGTAHILVRTATYGAGVGTDATVLLSTVMNFLAGEGWRDFTGRPMATWPPLFPLLLAAFGWVGIEPLAAGRWVNATAFGLTILVAGGWLRSHLRSRWLVLAASVAILTSLPLSDLASNFLTDPLFVLFTLLALMQLAAFLHRGGRTPLLLSAVFTALVVLTRYPGVVLVGVGVLLLLLRRAPPLAVRLKHAIVFGAVPSIPLAGVMLHNWAISKRLAGGRGGSGQSLSDSLSQVADVFRAWVIPPHALDWLGYLLWMAAGLAVLADRGSGLGGNKGTARPASPLFGLGPVLPFGVFAVAYLVSIVAVVPFTVPVIIVSRYLLPIYVPLLLAAVLLLDRFLCIEAAGWMAAVRYGLSSVVLLGAVAHIGFSAGENLRITTRAWGAGLDGAYNIADWQHSATLNYVKTNLSDSRTYSNNQFLVWFADRTGAIKKHRALPDRIRDWTRYAGRWVERGEDEVYIVWIKDDYRSAYHDYNDLDIRFLPGVEVMAELSDGVVFRVTAADAVEPFDEARLRAQKERYQERYVEQLLAQAGERVVRAGWDVYRSGRKLTYFKKPCASADVQAKFILHVTPVDPADLSFFRKRFGYDNLGFYFDRLSVRRGVRVGDQCIMTVDLPDYAIGRVRVGQWIAAGNRTVWEAEFSGGR